MLIVKSNLEKNSLVFVLKMIINEEGINPAETSNEILDKNSVQVIIDKDG